MNKFNTLSYEELENQLDINAKKLQDLRFKRVFGKLDNPKELNTTKKDIARIKTIMNQMKKSMKENKAK